MAELALQNAMQAALMLIPPDPSPARVILFTDDDAYTLTRASYNSFNVSSVRGLSNTTMTKAKVDKFISLLPVTSVVTFQIPGTVEDPDNGLILYMCNEGMPYMNGPCAANILKAKRTVTRRAAQPYQRQKKSKMKQVSDLPPDLSDIISGYM